LDARFIGFEHIKELYNDDSDFANVLWCLQNFSFWEVLYTWWIFV
jgi:hypothetical protein